MSAGAGGTNPARLVAPGESGEVLLARDVPAWVVRGARPGPIVWAWAPRGDDDPSMAQALAELRDLIHPRSLRGALGLLVDGPAPPLADEMYRWAEPMRAVSSDAAAVVLFSSLPPGFEAAPHVALDLDDKGARKVARALGAAYAAPPVVAPKLNRRILTAPTVTWIDGESDRVSRPVIDRATLALRSLLGKFGMTDDEPVEPPVRVVLRAIAQVQCDGPSVVEATVRPGDLVRAGQVVAYAGAPGLRSRAPLTAPATGVVLYVRTGRLVGGGVIGIGKLRRALPAVVSASQAEPRAGMLEIGWCERVDLPELGIRLKAKIDSGARTSALHVVAMRTLEVERDGRAVLEIEVPTGLRNRTVFARVEVTEFTQVRDSGGHAERRPVIETSLRLGGEERRVRVSLTYRGDMLFPMLVGRTALSSEMRIHPTRRFMLGKKR